MGYMKTIFTDIQLALEENNFVSVIETLNNATDTEEYKKQLLFDAIGTLARWQREDQERAKEEDFLQILEAARIMDERQGN